LWLLTKDASLLAVLFGILGGVIGFTYSLNSTPIYSAESKFILREGGGGGISNALGGLSSILTGSAPSSIERTVAIIATEKIIGKVLLSKIKLKNKNDLVINHYMKMSKSSGVFSSRTGFGSIEFQEFDTIPALFSIDQLKVYKKVINDFIGEKGLVKKSFDKKTGIISLKIDFNEEYFAIEVNKLIFLELSFFVKNQASEPSSLNASIMRKKVDSIQLELNTVRRQLARTTDQSLGLFLNEDKVAIKALAVKEQILLSMYGEAQKNYETVLFMGESASNTSSLTLLDSPYPPIKPRVKNKYIYTCVTFFLFFIFTLLVTLFRSFLKA